MAGAPVGVERVRLAARAVEREHQLRVQALAEGVLGGEALQLGGDDGVAAERQVVLEPQLEGVQATAHQPVGLDRPGAQQRRVGQRRSAEQRQRLAQELRGLLGGRAARLLDQGLEALDVELPGLERDPVAAGRVTIVSRPARGAAGRR